MITAIVIVFYPGVNRVMSYECEAASARISSTVQTLLQAPRARYIFSPEHPPEGYCAAQPNLPSPARGRHHHAKTDMIISPLTLRTLPAWAVVTLQQSSLLDEKEFLAIA